MKELHQSCAFVIVNNMIVTHSIALGGLMISPVWRNVILLNYACRSVVVDEVSVPQWGRLSASNTTISMPNAFTPSIVYKLSTVKELWFVSKLANSDYSEVMRGKHYTIKPLAVTILYGSKIQDKVVENLNFRTF